MHAFLSTLGPFLLLGFVLKLTGFSIRNVLALRVTVACGLLCDAVHYATRPQPIWGSSILNLVLVSINIALIAIILAERSTWWMPDPVRRLYSGFPTFSPGQFRKLYRLMQAETLPAGTQLAHEGEPIADLLLVDATRIHIVKQGETYPITGRKFVGEIAFLTGRPASADVTLPEGGHVFRIDGKALKALMKKDAAINNAVLALFGQDLAQKVAESVPISPRAAIATG